MENFKIFPLTAFQEKILFSNSAFPVSNYGKIVFPFDFFQNKYDVSGFKSSLVAEKLPDYDLVLFFDKLYKTVLDINTLSPEYINRQIRILVIVPLVLFVTGGAIRLFAQEESGFLYQISEVIGRWILQTISLIWCAAGIIILYVKAHRNEKNVQLQISGFIEQENIILAQKGELKWRAPQDHPYWIELDLLFKEKEHPEAFYKIIDERNFSDKNVIRFEFNEKERTYNRNIYHVDMTDGYIAKTEVDKFFLLLESRLGHELKEDQTRKRLTVLIVITVILFLFGVIAGFMGHLVISHFVLLATLLGFLSYGVEIVASKNQRSLHIRSKIKEFILQQNDYYEQLGIRWVLPPPTYKVIELWLDFKYVFEVTEKPLENLDIEKKPEKQILDGKDIDEIPVGRWGSRIDFSKLKIPKDTKIDFAKIRNSIFGVKEYDLLGMNED